MMVRFSARVSHDLGLDGAPDACRHFASGDTTRAGRSVLRPGDASNGMSSAAVTARGGEDDPYPLVVHGDDLVEAFVAVEAPEVLAHFVFSASTMLLLRRWHR